MLERDRTSAQVRTQLPPIHMCKDDVRGAGLERYAAHPLAQHFDLRWCVALVDPLDLERGSGLVVRLRLDLEDARLEHHRRPAVCLARTDSPAAASRRQGAPGEHHQERRDGDDERAQGDSISGITPPFPTLVGLEREG